MSRYFKPNRREWWEDEEEYYSGRYGNIFEESEAVERGRAKGATKNYSQHGGYTYKSYFYQKSFDFSVSLETRVRQLIKTISGKDLKLSQANGWGSDDDYFYYNPNDLTNATDDEVLGLIFHQLSRELFYDVKPIKKIKKDQPSYRHLLETLEDNRTDRLMVERYNGADYYLEGIWHNSKRESTKPRPDWRYPNNQIIPALEFCYNISVLAHNETGYTDSNKKFKTTFLKAIPHIESYLNSKTFDEAVKHYTAIKKFYPEPTEQEQNQMDEQMGATMLTDDQRKQAHRQAAREETASNGKSMEDHIPQFGASLDEQQKLQNRDYAAYANAMTAHAATINALHKLLSSIMADNDTKRYIGRQKRGKIDGKALHKLVSLGSDRIFKKEREIQRKKYAFSILVDQSGSMSGRNADNAFAGTVVLAEVFGRLRIPFQIVGFDYVSRTYKNFFTAGRKEVIGGIRHADGGGTNDRLALEKIGEQFAKLPNGYNKSVFVLTDGDGQGYRTRQIVNDLTSKQQIKVFGLALGFVSEQSMQNTYTKYALCENVSDLPSALVNLVREQFRRQ